LCIDRAASSGFGVGLTTIFVSSSVPFVGILQPNAANAVADSQFIEVGQQERAPDGETPFVTLNNGVQIKDYRIGDTDTSVIRSGSRVKLTIKGLLLNLNGIIFYDNKSNDPNGFGEGTPLVFTVGQFVDATFPPLFGFWGMTGTETSGCTPGFISTQADTLRTYKQLSLSTFFWQKMLPPHSPP
jgi:hypothetical protein